VIGHQTVAMGFNLETTGQFAEQFQKSMAVIIGNMHILTRRTTIHHVVPRTLEFDSQGTGHRDINRIKR